MRMKQYSQRRLRIAFVLSLSIFVFTTIIEAGSNCWAQSRSPHNLHPDPTVKRGRNPDSWTLSRQATSGRDDSIFDPKVSRSPDRSGSLRFTLSAQETSHYQSALTAQSIPVVPGKTYTLAYYLASTDVAAKTTIAARVYYNDRTFANGANYRNDVVAYQQVSVANQWQECVAAFTAPEGAFKMQVGAVFIAEPDLDLPRAGDNQATVWIDDFYVGEGLGFEQPRSAKKPYKSSKVKIDELGNIETLENGVWTPFFPIGIYKDNSRPYLKYSNLGFNMIMSGGDDQVREARKAVSRFNPNGMKFGFGFTGFVQGPRKRGGPAHQDYGNIGPRNAWTDYWQGTRGANRGGKSLSDRISRMVQADKDTVLWFYLDNELPTEWETFRQATQVIRNSDVDRPIYILQGSRATARAFDNDLSDGPSSDVTGTYLDPQGYNHQILDNLEQQKLPVVIAQINEIEHIRTSIYKAVINGARGIGFFKDNNPSNKHTTEGIDVMKAPWTADFPNIRREIDQLLPLIREKHWTQWKLYCNHSGIYRGTRDYKKRGHVILANQTDYPITATFAIEGLDYRAKIVRDFFTGKPVAKIAKNQFRVTLPARSEAVPADGKPFSTAVYVLSPK